MSDLETDDTVHNDNMPKLNMDVFIGDEDDSYVDYLP